MTGPDLDDDELEELAERQALWERVDRAFAAFDRLPPAIADGDHPLADDVREALGGKRPDDLGSAELRRIRHDLRLLTPDAYWAVFRAAARQVLVAEEHVDGLGEALVATLTPSADDGPETWLDERRARLDAQQRAAVGAFVRWYAEGESHLPRRERLLAAWADPDDTHEGPLGA